MAGRFSRGWQMAKASFGVLKRYPKLIVFPLLSAASFLLIIGTIFTSFVFGLLPSGFMRFWTDLPERVGDGWASLLALVALFVLLYVLTVAALFFNAALIYCAFDIHAGRTPSLRAGLRAASRAFPQILGWAAVATTVGGVLHIIQQVAKENLGILGAILGGLLEFAWSAVTYFVLPVLIAERIGPIRAVRESAALLRSRWGESASGEARFGVFGLLFGLQAALLCFVGWALTRAYGTTGAGALGPILIALGVLYAIATAVTIQALSSIFQAGVYLYARTGTVPASLQGSLIESAFRPRS